MRRKFQWMPSTRSISAAVALWAAVWAVLWIVLWVGVNTKVWAQSAEIVAPAGSANTAAPPHVQVPAVAQEDKPYGLGALWAQGDVVSKATLLILLGMSMGSWFVIVTKTLEQNKLGQESRLAQERFWLADSTAVGLSVLPDKGAYQHVVQAGLASAQKHAVVAQEIDLKSWLAGGIERALGQVQSRLQQDLSLLATVGSTAPFVGLFGTVWGIYKALIKIGTSGQIGIDKVAGPVGEVLIMTAIGLAVAVPAVLGYNALVRRNKTAIEALREFASDVHTQLLAKK